MRDAAGRRSAVWITGAVLAAALVVSAWWVQRYRYRPELRDNLYLPSGQFLTEMSLGYREIVADAVWFSAVQYYGEYRQGHHDLAYFRGLVNIITELDPHFVFAYVFGALVVSEDIGRFDAGVEILREGMAANPTSWELPFEVAFLHFVNRVDFKIAARYFDLASRMPGSPDHVKRFAAFVYSKAGRPEASIELWRKYIEYTENPFLKDLARRYIEKLEAEAAAAASRRRTG